MTFSPSIYTSLTCDARTSRMPRALSSCSASSASNRRLVGFDPDPARPENFRDLPAAPRSKFHLENLGPDQATNGAFVHGEEVAAHPVPAFIVVRVINADHDFQLRLPPEAGAGPGGASLTPGLKSASLSLPSLQYKLTLGL